MSQITAKEYRLRTGQTVLIRSALPSDAQEFLEMVRSMLKDTITVQSDVLVRKR